MPRGSYRLSTDGAALVERFACGAGPAGWRYVATREDEGSGAVRGRLDVVLDAVGAPLRVHVEAAGWVLRGGAVGSELLWRRGDAEAGAVADGFTGTSPVWLLAAARRCARRPEVTRLRLLRLGDEALATRLVDQAWSGTGTRRQGGLEVAGFEVTDLQTGQRGPVHCTPDVVLDAPGVELLALDPP